MASASSLSSFMRPPPPPPVPSAVDCLLVCRSGGRPEEAEPELDDDDDAAASLVSVSTDTLILRLRWVLLSPPFLDLRDDCEPDIWLLLEYWLRSSASIIAAAAEPSLVASWSFLDSSSGDDAVPLPSLASAIASVLEDDSALASIELSALRNDMPRNSSSSALTSSLISLMMFLRPSLMPKNAPTTSGPPARHPDSPVLSCSSMFIRRACIFVFSS
mmetsp:Transcript_16752/g.36337  ORF Transcript_16752/g.36337 Transcript_16752/m.36337 type:complete len:217 (-) Transcript_16752:110-760(-)